MTDGLDLHYNTQTEAIVLKFQDYKETLPSMSDVLTTNQQPLLVDIKTLIALSLPSSHQEMLALLIALKENEVEIAQVVLTDTTALPAFHANANSELAILQMEAANVKRDGLEISVIHVLLLDVFSTLQTLSCTTSQTLLDSTQIITSSTHKNTGLTFWQEPMHHVEVSKLQFVPKTLMEPS